MSRPVMDPSGSSPAQFVRGLGLLDSAMIVAGSMIGSGIFIVSADIARQVGSAGWLLVVWMLTGVLTLIAALCYGELAAMMPRAGGQYVYLREAYGPLVGFLYGWTLFLVIQTGTVAAVAVAFAKFLGVLAPQLSETHKLVSLGRFSLTPAALVAMGVLVLISTFGCINGMVLAGARVTYAMAQDGLFFKAAGRLNRQGVPHIALLVQGFWACALTLSGTYSDLLDYVIFAVLLFYALTTAGLVVLRRRRPQADRPYRAPGYPWLPVIYVVAASLIALDLLVSPKTRGHAWPGLLIVLAGVPVYCLWKRRFRAAAAS